MKWIVIFSISLTVNKSHEKNLTNNNELIITTRTINISYFLTLDQKLLLGDITLS